MITVQYDKNENNMVSNWLESIETEIVSAISYLHLYTI